MPIKPLAKTDLWLCVLLLAIYFLITAWALNYPIVGPDEPRYAAAARSMLRGADLIVPEFNTRPRLAKPILFYWLIAGTAWAGQKLGIGIVAGMRIVPLSMGAFVVLGTFLLSRRLRGQRIGFLAAGIVMTTLEFNALARELVVDMTLASFVLWAWLFFHIALERIERRAGAFLFLAAFYLMCALACLTKGPFMVALFVVLPILLYLKWIARMSVLSRCGMWWGMPLSLLLGLSWFVVLYMRGADSLSFFVRENIMRMVGQADHQHYLPFVFYLGVIWDNFSPWSILIPVALWQLYKYTRRCDFWPDNAKLLASALGVPFFLLGLAVSKRSLYLLPLYSFIAIGVACSLNDLLVIFGKFADRYSFAAIGLGAAICFAVAFIVTSRREKQRDSDHFYERVRRESAGSTLVMFGESASETVWYLDRRDAINRLERSDLSRKFFGAKDCMLLISERVLAREPALRGSLKIMAKISKGPHIYYLAWPDDPSYPLKPIVASQAIMKTQE